MDLTAFIHDPKLLLEVYLAFWLAGGLASSMPDPVPTSSLFYVWLHNFAQAITAGLKQFRVRCPEPKPKDPTCTK